MASIFAAILRACPGCTRSSRGRDANKSKPLSSSQDDVALGPRGVEGGTARRVRGADSPYDRVSLDISLTSRFAIGMRGRLGGIPRLLAPSSDYRLACRTPPMDAPASHRRRDGGLPPVPGAVGRRGALCPPVRGPASLPSCATPSRREPVIPQRFALDDCATQRNLDARGQGIGTRDWGGDPRRRRDRRSGTHKPMVPLPRYGQAPRRGVPVEESDRAQLVLPETRTAPTGRPPSSGKILLGLPREENRHPGHPFS